MCLFVQNIPSEIHIKFQNAVKNYTKELKKYSIWVSLVFVVAE